jgi:alanyl-tRNA synthetase
MSTNKLYYTDPYLGECNTEIEHKKQDEQGFWYAFRDTIFYPQGGGQAADTGIINGATVRHVEADDDIVWHLLEDRIKNPVEMKLNWQERYINMQQHTGQHILSASFKKLYNLNTLSVHLGSDITMIELDTKKIDEAMLNNCEAHANQIIRTKLAVEAEWIRREDVDEYKTRRAIKIEDDNIRLIRIGEFDCVGCGGTHVKSTSEVGLIKIYGAEKIRNHIRVKIKIGDSAYHYYNTLHKTFQKIGNLLTTSIEELSDRIEELNNANKESAREINKLNERWLAERARNLECNDPEGCFFLEGLTKEQLKIISKEWLQINKMPCFFISSEENNTNFYIRCPETFERDVQDFIRHNKSQFALKGGGSRDFAVGEIDRNRLSEVKIDTIFQTFVDFLNAKK